MERLSENIIEHIACRLNRYFNRRIFDIVHGYSANRANSKDQAMVALAKAVQPALLQIQQQHEYERRPQVVEWAPDEMADYLNQPQFRAFDPRNVGYVN